MKPPMVASIRNLVSCSFKNRKAKKATQIGMVNSRANTEASGSITTPIVHRYWAKKCTTFRAKCSLINLPVRSSGSSARPSVRMTKRPTIARKNSTCWTDSVLASSRAPTDMPMKEIMLRPIHRSPCVNALCGNSCAGGELFDMLEPSSCYCADARCVKRSGGSGR
ncbi:hypothetical protein D3C73_1040090 [compost metagenome]